MNENRINNDMNTLEAINALADGVPAAFDVLAKIVQNSEENMWLLDLVTLDSFEIYGINIWKLYNFACNQKIKDTLDTIAHIRIGIFPFQKIKQNLDMDNPIPFVDKKIFKDYAMGVEQEIPASVLYSRDYQELILHSFIKRLDKSTPNSKKKPPQPGSEE